MGNERLRSALSRNQWSTSSFAEMLHVDPKTAERWIATGRRPHRRTALAAAKLLREDMHYLWPEIERRVNSEGTDGEVVAFYSARSDVPKSLWLSLLRSAHESVDILVYAGLHLPEANPSWPREIKEKAESGVKFRIAFGDPDSANVRSRGDEEGVGEGLAARIRYALTWQKSILNTANIDVFFHDTVLYNSIPRFDDDLLVNPHVYGIPAWRAPLLHLRRMDGGALFETYVESFEIIWKNSKTLKDGV